MNELFIKTKERIKSFLVKALLLNKWQSPYQRRNQHADQKSVWISGRTRRRAYPYYHDSHMFVEDMYVGIMPFMIYRGEREKYPVVTEPVIDRTRERMIAVGISGNEHAFFLGDAISEFVRSTAHTLFQEGVAYFEINQTRNSGALESFEFESVSPYGLFRFGSYYYQFVSWGDAKADQTRVQIVRIPKDKIFKVELPRELTNRSKYKRLLKRLYNGSKESIPSFQMKAMEQNKNIGFDLGEFAKGKYIEWAILTKNFGWDQRQGFKGTNYITEYHSILRFLRRKKAEAKVRTMLIDKLNEVLNSEPLSLGIRLQMQNLTTEEAVVAQEARLKEGGVKFIDIFNALNQ
jgi:hypothetical protein